MSQRNIFRTLKAPSITCLVALIISIAMTWHNKTFPIAVVIFYCALMGSIITLKFYSCRTSTDDSVQNSGKTTN
jgi:hypothetical protein